MIIPTSEVVLIAKGSVSERIDCMIDTIVLARALNIKAAMIWTDHAVNYDNLYLNNIKRVDTNYLVGKHYVYNPDESELRLIVDAIESDPGGDMVVVIETSKPIRRARDDVLEHTMARKKYYHELLSEHISGTLLGRLNLMNYPRKPFVYGTSKFGREMRVDAEVLDVEDAEVREYVKTLVVCRSDVIVCERPEDLGWMRRAANVNVTPLIVTFSTKELENDPLVAHGILGHFAVVHPDVHRLYNACTI